MTLWYDPSDEDSVDRWIGWIVVVLVLGGLLGGCVWKLYRMRGQEHLPDAPLGACVSCMPGFRCVIEGGERKCVNP